MVSKFKLNPVKSGEIKETISRMEIASNYAGELTIEVIPLNKIELDPENKRELALTLHDAMHGINKEDPEYERKKQDWKSLESLAKTIREAQLINPIYVYRYGNMCRLIAGERRTLASCIAGKQEIIARIAGQRPVGSKLRVLQWIENNERDDLSLSERLASIEAILSEYFSEIKEVITPEKINTKLVSDLTGMSPTQARRYVLIVNSNSEIKNAIKEGKIDNIKLVELICSAKNQEEQDELLRSALSGKSLDSMIKMKKEIDTINQKRLHKRGRSKTYVKIGNVKPTIAKIIFKALTSSNILDTNVLNQINLISNNMRWDSSESIEKSFRKIFLLLEGAG